jgi:hypothetical protein
MAWFIQIVRPASRQCLISLLAVANLGEALLSLYGWSLTNSCAIVQKKRAAPICSFKCGSSCSDHYKQTGHVEITSFLSWMSTNPTVAPNGL